MREANGIASGKMHVFSLFLVLLALGLFSTSSMAQNCQRYEDINGDPLVLENYECENPVSKGDTDTVTPQIKIVYPRPGQIINYGKLEENEDGIKLLPIKIVVNPEYIVDFAAASNAATQYLFVPQEADRGHVHAYCTPSIKVRSRRGHIRDVEFLGNENRADKTGAFCVFREPDPEESTDEYQVLTTDCPIFASERGIERFIQYTCKVDATEHSHGPRLKNHPRDVPPGDQVNIRFVNVR